VEGWDSKRLYVWFEAVIGYLSATIELARLRGEPEAWREWWTNPEARAYYFIGKDNIPFHAVFWPAQLIGAGEAFGKIFEGRAGEKLVLPHDVPANEFMNLEGQKISGSRNWAVWGQDFLTRYDPDPLRYYLTANMPEAKDTDWDWQDFFNRNNNELVATWGNLANRVLSFSYKHWEGRVPDIGAGDAPDLNPESLPLRPVDRAILATVEAGFASVSEHLEAVRLRAALAEAIRLASEVNKYLDTVAPWKEVKEDKEAAAKSIYTALRAVDSLKILLAPFLPFTADRLHALLGYDGSLFGRQFTETVRDSLGEHLVLRYDPAGAVGRWEPSRLPPGQALRQPAPLFKKLEESIVEEERGRLGQAA
jgi:methionyl-tRNA synthetase